MKKWVDVNIIRENGQLINWIKRKWGMKKFERIGEKEQTMNKENKKTFNVFIKNE